MKVRIRTTCVVTLGVCVLLLSACHYQGLRKKLDPENEELLSKVRYLITQKEEKAFLELLDTEKKVFWVEFWNKRDPIPDTEENELKKEYFDRLEKADQTFQGEGRPGWLTDRGKIYILYGPPTNQMKSLLGRTECTEIWYYANFPVVFQDMTCIGEFRLATYDLSPISSLNINLMSNPSMISAFRLGGLTASPEYLDFEWDLTLDPVSKKSIRGMVRLEIPFSRIWFTEENGILSATFNVLLLVQSTDGQVVWQKEQSFPVEIEQEELKAAEKRQVGIDIPFHISDNTDILFSGENKMSLTLTNKTDGSTRMKEKILKIECFFKICDLHQTQMIS